MTEQTEQPVVSPEQAKPIDFLMDVKGGWQVKVVMVPEIHARRASLEIESALEKDYDAIISETGEFLPQEFLEYLNNPDRSTLGAEFALFHSSDNPLYRLLEKAATAVVK